MIIQKEDSIIKLNNQYNGIKLDTNTKSVFILIWNKIENKFNEFAIQADYHKELKALDIKTHEETIELNHVVYSPQSNDGQLRIINLLKEYDEENYKPFDPQENLKYRGLTRTQKEECDDYLYMINDTTWIEENPSEWNTSYDQLLVNLPIYGNDGPSTCWRIQ